MPSMILLKSMESTNTNTGYKALIEDDAELLSETEVEILLDEMMPLTEYGNIVFKSISSNSQSTEQYARSYYHNKFNTTSGTVFLIDMFNRIIYIFSI